MPPDLASRIVEHLALVALVAPVLVVDSNVLKAERNNKVAAHLVADSNVLNQRIKMVVNNNALRVVAHLAVNNNVLKVECSNKAAVHLVAEK